MLTVLIKYEKSYREVLLPADAVEFSLAGEDAGLLVTLKAETQHLAMTEEGDPDVRNVFVMNDQGQTVGRYTL